MLKKITSLLTVGLVTGVSFAQTPHYIHCASDHAISYQEELTPGYRSIVNSAFDYAKERAIVNGQQKNSYTIPVVVHIVYNTPEQNLHDTVIFNQIANLNKDFNRQNDDAGNVRPVFNPVVGSADIHFQLAQYDPDGNPTNGITRTQTSTTSFGSFNFFLGDMSVTESVKSSTDGGISPWNQDEYLNIWVCNMSISFMGQETTALLGYATPPDGLSHWPAGSTEGMKDGVVIQYQVFGSNNPNPLPDPSGNGGNMEVLGRTVTHEVGHYLGLRHIWGDGGCAEQDGVDDTPNAAAQSDFDCNTSKNTCVDNIAELGGDAPDMIENFMDYSAESCQNSFTLGQIGIMRSVLENFRPDLGDGNPLGITTQKSIEASVFPNPFKNEITVSIETGKADHIRLISTEGRVVFTSDISEGSLSFQTENIETGMYIVQLTYQSDIVFTQKLIKH